MSQALTTGASLEEIETWPEQIAAVTAEDVQKAAGYLLPATRPVTGILEPQDSKAEAAPEKPAP